MSIENIVQGLRNKLTALEAKRKIALEKGNLELFQVFDTEYSDTKLDLALIEKATEQISYYESQDIKDKLKLYLLENLPNLAFYFRESSINAVISDSLDKAFDKLIKEHFTDKIVNIVEGGNKDG